MHRRALLTSALVLPLLGPLPGLWVWLLVRRWVLESRLGKSRRVLLKR